MIFRSNEHTGFTHVLVYKRSFLAASIQTGSTSDRWIGHEQQTCLRAI